MSAEGLGLLGPTGDVRLMTLAEIEAELQTLDERRRLLMRARKFVVELSGRGLSDGAPEPSADGRRKGGREA